MFDLLGWVFAAGLLVLNLLQIRVNSAQIEFNRTTLERFKGIEREVFGMWRGERWRCSKEDS